jgi:hypothetical protein
MGRRGFEHADRLLAGDEPDRLVLPTEVVLRDSTGAPPVFALAASDAGRTTRSAAGA